MQTACSLKAAQMMVGATTSPSFRNYPALPMAAGGNKQFFPPGGQIFLI